jgi:hypothetical protein
VGCSRVTSGGDEHVDDLPELVDTAVQVPPPAGDLHIGLVHQPAVTDGVPARPGGLSEQWREPLHLVEVSSVASIVQNARQSAARFPPRSDL